MDIYEFGKTMRDRRKSLNITQFTLASLAGVGLNTIVAIERGNGNPQLQTVMAIADTLGLQVSLTLKD